MALLFCPASTSVSLCVHLSTALILPPFCLSVCSFAYSSHFFQPPLPSLCVFIHQQLFILLQLTPLLRLIHHQHFALHTHFCPSVAAAVQKLCNHFGVLQSHMLLCAQKALKSTLAPCPAPPFRSAPKQLLLCAHSPLASFPNIGDATQLAHGAAAHTYQFH